MGEKPPLLQNVRQSMLRRAQLCNADNDYITLSSDEELIVALTTAASQPIKLYIHLKSNNAQGSNSQGVQHPGVFCDGCEGGVFGYRYKCVTCPDVDLCAKCEGSGKHSEHFMLRMASPINLSSHPKVFRKLFGRPHKFHRRHGWERSFMQGESQGPNRCPFTQHENAAAEVPDMFDFSELMKFINSLGVATTAGGAEATASSQAQSTASSNAQPTASSQAQPNRPQPQESRQTTSNPNAYLNGIGQAIAAFLDPFDMPAKKKNKITMIIKKHVLEPHCPRYGHGPKSEHGPFHSKHGHGPKPSHGPFDSKHGHGPKPGHGPLDSKHGHGPKPGHGPFNSKHGHGPKPGHGPLDSNLGHGPKPGHGPFHSKQGHGLHALRHFKVTHGLKHRLCGPRLIGVYRPKYSHHIGLVHVHGPRLDSGICRVRLAPRMELGGCSSLRVGLPHDDAVETVTIVDDEPNIENCNGVDVTFDVRCKTPGTQEPSGASTQGSQSPSTPATQQQPAGSSPSASSNSEAAPATPAAVNPILVTVNPTLVAVNPDPVAVNPTVPVSSPAHSETVREGSPTPSGARRNSDDWTLLNRESPVRLEMAMDVEESRGPKPPVVYPVLPREAPSAPPQASGGFTDVERKSPQFRNIT
ncbi:Sequestosome-1 [Homalodisca vitripennis]|nr:Sequestosome-1 [Homalodisca vitripennis]